MVSELNEYDLEEGRDEILIFISKILFFLHIIIICVVTYTSERRVETFFCNLGIPVISRGLVLISLKKNVNLNLMVCVLCSALIFTSCYISGKESPSWLTGITWLCAMFFLFPKRPARIFWLTVGFTLIGIGSYLSGKTIYSITGFEVAFVLFSIILDRTFSFLVLQNKRIFKQKKELEIKQKEILDSIHYARRIQNALLPSEKFILRILSRTK